MAYNYKNTREKNETKWKEDETHAYTLLKHTHTRLQTNADGRMRARAREVVVVISTANGRPINFVPFVREIVCVCAVSRLFLQRFQTSEHSISICVADVVCSLLLTVYLMSSNTRDGSLSHSHPSI